MDILKKITDVLGDPRKRGTTASRAEILLTYENSISEIQKIKLPNDDFRSFLDEIHDSAATCDPSLRALYLRTIRYCISDKDHCATLVEQQFHWIVVSSLEREDRDNYYIHERIQALKLITKLIEYFPLETHLSCVRSIVAIASQKDESLCRICLELLRKLSLSNPIIVAQANGIKTLFEAVLDPDFSEVAESIMMTLLYHLNKPTSRKHIRPQLELQTLLAPLTDLDTSPADILPKRRAACKALILCLRCWAGIAFLASDSMCLVTLVRMLSDPKSIDFFILSATLIGSSEKRQATLPHSTMHSVPLSTNSLLSLPLSPPKTSMANKRKGNSATATASAVMFTPSPDSSTSTSTAGMGSWGVSDLIRSKANPTTPRPSSKNNNSTPNISSPNTPEGIAAISMHMNTTNATVSSTPPRAPMPLLRPTAWLGSTGMKKFEMTSSSPIPHHVTSSSSSSAAATAAAIAMEQDRNSIAKELNAAALCNTAVTVYSQDSEGDNETIDSELESVGSLGSFRRTSTQNSYGDGNVHPRMDIDKINDIHTHVKNLDPLYNLIDNYSAYLICAFLHANIINTLIFLSTSGDTILVQKSRDLLVAVLRIVAAVLPERWSNELLISPQLVQYAASLQSRTKPSRAHKATQMLAALADAFAVTTFEQHRHNHDPNPNPNHHELLHHHHYHHQQHVSSQHINTSNTSSTVPSSTRSSLVTASAAGNGNGGSGGSGTGGSGGSGASTPRESVVVIPRVEVERWSLEDVCMEIVQASCTRTSAGMMYADILHDLKTAMIARCGSIELQRQLDSSRVNGKEPWRWDWSVIGEVLEYSFRNSERLAEAMKTKWVKRVCSFFLCSGENKALFPHLDWQPHNLIYLEYGARLYGSLSEHNISTFLDQDRSLCELVGLTRFDYSRTVVFADESFCEMVKWSGSNWLDLEESIILDLNFDLTTRQLLILQKPQRVLIFSTSRLVDLVGRLQTLFRDISPEIIIFSTNIPDVSSWEGDPYHNIKKLLMPLDCGLFILSSSICRDIFPLTLHGIGCWGAVENTSIEDLVAEDVPAASRSLLKNLANELAGALIYNLDIDPTGSVFALGKTSNLLGHTLQPVLSNLVKLRSNHPTLSAVLKHGNMTTDKATTPSASPSASSPHPHPPTPATLIIIDRTSDLSVSLSHGSCAYTTLAHRILSTLPRQQSSSTKEATKGFSFESPTLADVSLSSPNTYESLSVDPSSVLSSLHLGLPPTMCIEDDNLRRSIFSKSEEEARNDICAVLEARIVAEGGVLPPPKKRGLGAAVFALVQSLENSNPAKGSQGIRRGRSRRTAAGADDEEEEEVAGEGCEGVDGCQDPCGTAVERSLDILSPCMAVIEAMRRSTVLQQCDSGSSSDPSTSASTRSDRCTYDERCRREKEMDDTAASRKKGNGNGNGNGAVDGIRSLCEKTEELSRRLGQKQKSPVKGNKGDGTATTGTGNTTGSKGKEDNDDVDIQHVLLNIARFYAKFDDVPISCVVPMWSKLADYVVEHCPRKDLTATELFSEDLVVDICQNRSNGFTVSDSSSDRDESRQRLRLEVEDVLSELGELLREIQGLSCVSKAKDVDIDVDVASTQSTLTSKSKSQAQGVISSIIEDVFRHPEETELTNGRFLRMGIKHVDNPLLKLARAGLGLLSQGLGRFGLGGGVAAQQSRPWDHKTVVVFVIGGLSFAEVGQVEHIISTWKSLGVDKHRVILGSTAMISPDDVYNHIYRNMRTGAQR
eukprot:gene384-698_t